MTQRYRWTATELATAFALHDAGRNPIQIASELGNKSWRSVAQKIRERERRGRAGVPALKTKHTLYPGTREIGITKLAVTKRDGEAKVSLPFVRGTTGEIVEIGENQGAYNP